MEEKTFCSKCQQYKPNAEFRTKSGNRKYPACRDCRRAYSREWMRERLAIPHAHIWNSLKTQIGCACVRCGFNEFCEVLEFHPIFNVDAPPLANMVNRFAYSPTPAAWGDLIRRTVDHALLCPTCVKSLREEMWELSDDIYEKMDFPTPPTMPLPERD